MATGGTNRDLRNRVLLQLAYDTLARRSELIALALTDLEEGTAGDGTVMIRRSKTDQEGASMVRYIAPDTMHDLRAWCVVATSGRLHPTQRQ